LKKVVEMYDSPSSKYFKKEIYSGTIEALNPMPGIMREGWSPSKLSDSVDKFEK
jgi:hypothetical protein